MTITAAWLLPMAAQASPTCTKEPASKWLSEAAMKQKVSELGYHDIRVFKITKSGCYEIYGFNKDGRKAEVYFNPVDGAVVQANVD
ncbi:MAG: PepSY domain-containing protein [Nevskia sp.]|nr:PepSY domain-containing protein [Nevskia sp.]